MSLRPWISLLALLAAGCAFVTDADEKKRLDPDGDGVNFPDDCDDDDDQIGLPETFYVDADGDTFGDAQNTVAVCRPTVGQVRDSSDCNDGDPAVYPGAAEVPYDTVDQDCNGLDIDDVDADGYPAAEAGGDDCDDADPAIHPEAPDAWYDGVDSNCAGDSDYDADVDGYDAVEFGGADCDDTDAGRYPNPSVAEVYYNGFDENCDALTDGDGDMDGDGHWAADYYARLAAGGYTAREFVPNTDDCWDDDSSTPVAYAALDGYPQPGAAEVNPEAGDSWYDGVDQNCDRADDFDQDGDGYRSDAYADRYGFYGDDCDDAQALTNPGVAFDTPYDGVDEDCDGSNDYDFDRDGYVSADFGGSDCIDDDTMVNPGAAEVCDNGVDDDCDGTPNTCGLYTGRTGADANRVMTAGTTSGDGYFGASVAACGDVNGDGKGDIFIGVPNDSASVAGGGAAVYYKGGYASGSSPNMRLSGSTPYGSFGRAVDCGKDIDDDGYVDFLVGEPLGNTGATQGGSIYLSMGPPGGSGSTLVLGQITSTLDYGNFGAVAQLSDDLTGDGASDLVASSPGAAGIYILRGPISTPAGRTDDRRDWQVASITTSKTYGDFGRNLTQGDINGDGNLDLVAGAPYFSDLTSYEGYAFTYFGPFDADIDLIDYDAAMIGGGSYEYAGMSVAANGDLNGDGIDDVAVGGPNGGASYEGSVYLNFGGAAYGSRYLSSSDAILSGATNSFFGASVTMVPDLDADGVDELLVGALNAGRSYEGGAALFTGPLSGAVSLSAAAGTYVGDTSYSYFGQAAAAPGDVDGDGDGDLVIGAPYQYNGTAYTGALFTFFGGDI